MTWLLCVLFAICPTETEIPTDITPLAQLLIEAEQALGDEWYVFFVTDQPYLHTLVFSNDEGAVIRMTQVDLLTEEIEASYFSYADEMETYFQVTLSNYAPYELEASCEFENLQIFDFMGEYNGNPYLIRSYIEHQPNAARIVDIYFPADAVLNRDAYSRLFYPDMVTCPQENIETEQNGD